MRVEFRRVDWAFASEFRIANRVQMHAASVLVELGDGELTGRGEGLGVFYHGETIDSIMTQLNFFKQTLAGCISRSELHTLMPPGGARNAVDCALWDLEAKRAGRRVWEIAGIESVKPLITAFTLGVDTPQEMAAAARKVKHYSLLKLKLTGDGDVERVRAVRDAHPQADIIVDANQSWGERQLHEFTPRLAELGVKLIEQPLPSGEDGVLYGYNSPVPLCADESCQTTQSLPSLVGKYQYINIKLDKTGGLTEALHLACAARAEGFKLMVGCMMGSSLSMAPAFIVGQLCSFVDLDGPLWSVSDMPDGIRYEGNRMFAPTRRFWG